MLRLKSYVIKWNIWIFLIIILVLYQVPTVFSATTISEYCDSIKPSPVSYGTIGGSGAGCSDTTGSEYLFGNCFGTYTADLFQYSNNNPLCPADRPHLLCSWRMDCNYYCDFSRGFFSDKPACTPTTITCGDGIDQNCDSVDETNCANGASCSSDSACSSGSCYNSICQAKGSSGNSCDTPADCSSNICTGVICQSGTATLICKPKLPNGDSCDENSDCITTCTTYHIDNDNDEYRASTSGKGICGTSSSVTESGKTWLISTATVDCNDNDANVNPGKQEICSDGVDNDCDSLIDESPCGCPSGTTLCSDNICRSPQSCPPNPPVVCDNDGLCESL